MEPNKVRAADRVEVRGLDVAYRPMALVRGVDETVLLVHEVDV
jgi:hypothetical protein